MSKLEQLAMRLYECAPFGPSGRTPGQYAVAIVAHFAEQATVRRLSQPERERLLVVLTRVVCQDGEYRQW